MYMGNHDYMLGCLGYSLREAEEGVDPNTATEDEGTDTASADPNTATDTEDTSTDDTGDSTEESPEAPEGTDPNTEEDTDDTGDADNGDENFDIDATDDTSAGEEEGGEEDSTDPNADDGGDDDSDEEDDSEEVDEDSLKAMDGKLYEDLSPAEQKMKIRHHKQLFTDLLYTCANIGDKLNAIYIEDQDANLQVKRAGSMIFDLKQMISDYFLNTYDSKSYQENDIMFNRYLAVLNQVKGLTDDIKKTYFSDSE